jgi:hypothetical protein
MFPRGKSSAGFGTSRGTVTKQSRRTEQEPIDEVQGTPRPAIANRNTREGIERWMVHA